MARIQTYKRNSETADNSQSFSMGGGWVYPRPHALKWPSAAIAKFWSETA